MLIRKPKRDALKWEILGGLPIIPAVVGGEVVACAEDDDQVELLVVMYQHDAKLHEVSQDG